MFLSSLLVAFSSISISLLIGSLVPSLMISSLLLSLVSLSRVSIAWLLIFWLYVVILLSSSHSIVNTSTTDVSINNTFDGANIIPNSNFTTASTASSSSSSIKSSSSRYHGLGHQTIVKTAILNFPKDKQTIEFLFSALGKHKSRYYLSLKFVEMQSTNKIAHNDMQSTYGSNHSYYGGSSEGNGKGESISISNNNNNNKGQKTKVTIIVRDKYKFECTVKSSYPTSHCLRRFDMTSYWLFPKTIIRFIVNSNNNHNENRYTIHATVRRVIIGADESGEMDHVVDYSSSAEALKASEEFQSMMMHGNHNQTGNQTEIRDNSYPSRHDEQRYVQRNSGLIEMSHRRSWLASKNDNSNVNNKLKFMFSIKHVPHQRYFISSKVHISAVDLNYDFEEISPRLVFRASIDDQDPLLLKGKYIGDGTVGGTGGSSDDDAKCGIMLTTATTFRSCLEFVEVFPKAIADGNVSIGITWQHLGVLADRLLWNIVFSCTLHALPSPLERWRMTGVNTAMIECMIAQPFWSTIKDGADLGRLIISNKGLNISIESAFPTISESSRLEKAPFLVAQKDSRDEFEFDPVPAVTSGAQNSIVSNVPWLLNSDPLSEPTKMEPRQQSETRGINSLPLRLKDMEQGVRRAVELFMSTSNEPFPELDVLVWPSDTSYISSSHFSECSSVGIVPILGQNRDFIHDNLLVLVPDFSYFSSFIDGHDHGSTKDVWFSVIDAELKVHSKSKFDIGGAYSSVVFEEKAPTAIYRGRNSNRRFAYLRHTIAEFCSSMNTVNATEPSYVSRVDMCSNHQALITVPGNGVWSWATKFNLLCNSVSLLVPPDSINGECWETRSSMGLRPWVHYLPLSASRLTVCQKLNSLVVWIRNHQDEAKSMARRSRQVVLEKLNRETILRDFADILITYAALNTSRYQV